MEKKLAEYKCDTNEAISLKLGRFLFLLYYKYLAKIYNHIYVFISYLYYLGSNMRLWK